MSDTETHTVETAYGTAEIETYDCDSCGNTVAYENTVEFTIGSREGRACEHCEETGPVSFPRKAIDWALPYDVRNGDTFGLGFHILFAPVVVPLATVIGFDEKSDGFFQGYATAIVSVLVWTSAAAFAVLLWFLL